VYSAILNVFDNATVTPPILEESGNKTPIPTPETNQTPTPPQEEKPQNPPVAEKPNENVNASPSQPSFTKPLSGAVYKPFSDDVLVYSETMNDYRLHCGVDLVGTLGTPVKAFTDGVVLRIYEDPLMGQTVVLDHGNNMISTYQNLSPQLPEEIQVGALVNEGQVVGGIGETTLIECEQEPHLHFEVTVNGKAVDPMSFFR